MPTYTNSNYYTKHSLYIEEQQYDRKIRQPVAYM